MLLELDPKDRSACKLGFGVSRRLSGLEAPIHLTGIASTVGPIPEVGISQLLVDGP
jgi:hypothetical protein